jgi:hypothetical protein
MQSIRQVLILNVFLRMDMSLSMYRTTFLESHTRILRDAKVLDTLQGLSLFSL